MYYVHPNMTIVKADSYRIMTGERIFETYALAYAFITKYGY